MTLTEFMAAVDAHGILGDGLGVRANGTEVQIGPGSAFCQGAPANGMVKFDLTGTADGWYFIQWDKLEGGVIRQYVAPDSLPLYGVLIHCGEVRTFRDLRRWLSVLSWWNCVQQDAYRSIVFAREAPFAIQRVQAAILTDDWWTPTRMAPPNLMIIDNKNPLRIELNAERVEGARAVALIVEGTYC